MVLVPPNKSQLPPIADGVEAAENGAGTAGERGEDPTIRLVMGRGIGKRCIFQKVSLSFFFVPEASSSEAETPYRAYD